MTLLLQYCAWIVQTSLDEASIYMVRFRLSAHVK
jgi:hypothetical protein